MVVAVSWPTLKLVQLADGFRQVVSLVEHPLDDLPAEVTGALTRFLVVRSCGYLEQVVEECISAYVERHSDFRVAAYAQSAWRQGTNPSPAKLIELVTRFDPSWGAELAGLLAEDDEFLHRSIKNLVSTRNRVAHGSSEQVRVRPALDFASNATLVVDWFVQTFDPTR
jgi:hypothetical protein